MKLHINLALVLHALLVAAQGLNYISGMVPDRYKFPVATALGLIQLIVGVIQHYSPIPERK